MKASVQYNDFKGVAAADIADHLGGPGGDDLASLARRFKLDQNRFKIVAISIYGVSDPFISLICVDKIRSEGDQEHIVSMMYDKEGDDPLLKDLFKRFNVVLHDKHDKRYVNMEFTEEVRYSEFHDDEQND